MHVKLFHLNWRLTSPWVIILS